MRLAAAAESGKIEEVQAILKVEGANAKFRIDRECALHAVLRGNGSDGHKLVLLYLLEQNPNVYQMDQFGDNILRLATQGAVLAIKNNDKSESNWVKMVDAIVKKEVDYRKKERIPLSINPLMETKSSDFQTTADYLELVFRRKYPPRIQEALKNLSENIEEHANMQFKVKPASSSSGGSSKVFSFLSAPFSWVASFWKTPSTQPKPPQKQDQQNSEAKDHRINFD